MSLFWQCFFLCCAGFFRGRWFIQRLAKPVCACSSGLTQPYQRWWSSSFSFIVTALSLSLVLVSNTQLSRFLLRNRLVWQSLPCCTLPGLTADYCRIHSPTLPFLFPPSLTLIKSSKLCRQRISWVSLLIWQQTSCFLCGLAFLWLRRLLDWIVCHVKLHPYFLSFSSLLERPERSLLRTVGSPKQNCGFCYHLERGSYITVPKQKMEGLRVLSGELRSNLPFWMDNSWIVWGFCTVVSAFSTLWTSLVLWLT